MGTQRWKGTQRWAHQIRMNNVEDETRATTIRTAFDSIFAEFPNALVSIGSRYEGWSLTCRAVGDYDWLSLRQVTKLVSAFGHDESLAPGDVFITSSPVGV